MGESRWTFCGPQLQGVVPFAKTFLLTWISL